MTNRAADRPSAAAASSPESPGVGWSPASGWVATARIRPPFQLRRDRAQEGVGVMTAADQPPLELGLHDPVAIPWLARGRKLHPALEGRLPTPVGTVAEDADCWAEHLERQRLRQVLELAVAKPGQVEVHRGILTQPADSLPSGRAAFSCGVHPVVGARPQAGPSTPVGQVASYRWTLPPSAALAAGLQPP